MECSRRCYHLLNVRLYINFLSKKSFIFLFYEKNIKFIFNTGPYFFCCCYCFLFYLSMRQRHQPTLNLSQIVQLGITIYKEANPLFLVYEERIFLVELPKNLLISLPQYFALFFLFHYLPRIQCHIVFIPNSYKKEILLYSYRINQFIQF